MRGPWAMNDSIVIDWKNGTVSAASGLAWWAAEKG